MSRASLTVAAALALGVSTHAAAKVASTRDDGFVTQDSVQVTATPLETWLALIQPSEWWDDRHTWSGDAANLRLTPQGNGCFCETLPGADRPDGSSLDGSAAHAVVVQAYPLKVLRMRGGFGPLQGEPAAGVLTITLEEADGGTRILWEYNVGGSMRFEIPKISEAVAGVMSHQALQLGKHLGLIEPPKADEAVAPQESGETVSEVVDDPGREAGDEGE